MDTNKEWSALFAERLGLPVETVRPDVALNDLVPSSFSLVELLIDLQENFGFRVTQAELGGLHTLGDLIALIERKRSDITRTP